MRDGIVQGTPPKKKKKNQGVSLCNSWGSKLKDQIIPQQKKKRGFWFMRPFTWTEIRFRFHAVTNNVAYKEKKHGCSYPQLQEVKFRIVRA